MRNLRTRRPISYYEHEEISNDAYEYPNQSSGATETQAPPTISLGEALKSSSEEFRRVKGYVLGVMNLNRYFDKDKPGQDLATFEKILDFFGDAEATYKKIDDKQTSTKKPKLDVYKPQLDANVCEELKLGVIENNEREPNPGVTENHGQGLSLGVTNNNIQKANFGLTEDHSQEPTPVATDNDTENDDQIDAETANGDITEDAENIDQNAVQTKHLWKCKECGKVPSSRDRLRNHKRIHGGTQKFNCNHCSYKTNVKYYYKRHAQTHSKAKGVKKIPETNVQKVDASWQCDECQNMFCSRAFLRSHKRMHGGHKKFNCTICGYLTDVKYYFERHMRSAHRTESLTYKCDSCDFSSHNRKVFEVHVGLHANKKAIRCEMCDYMCTSKKYLHAHLLRVHVPTKRYRCAACQSAFNCAEYLRRHMRNVHFRKD